MTNELRDQAARALLNAECALIDLGEPQLAMECNKARALLSAPAAELRLSAGPGLGRAWTPEEHASLNAAMQTVAAAEAQAVAFGHVYRVAKPEQHSRPWNDPRHGVVFELGAAPKRDGGIIQYLDLCTAPPASAAGVDEARDGWHIANGVAELAMKHRDEAERSLQQLSRAVQLHADDLDRCAPLIECAFPSTAKEIRKAANELRAALTTDPQP